MANMAFMVCFVHRLSFAAGIATVEPAEDEPKDPK